MADLDLAEPRLAAHALHRADRLRRAESHGFVENDPAVHRSAARRARQQLSICCGLFAHDVLRLVALRRRRRRGDEGGERAAFAAHDDRREFVEPPGAARFYTDRLREIDVAAKTGEGPVIPVALAVLNPDAAAAVGLPVADRAVAGEYDAGLDAERARFPRGLDGRRRRKGKQQGGQGECEFRFHSDGAHSRSSLNPC